MEGIFFLILSIILLFFIFLGVKELIKKEFCVLCASIFVTWVSFLALYLIGIFKDPIIIALLIGQSIVGIFYVIESKVKEELKLFRLPFIITLIIFGYSLFEIPKDFVNAISSLLLIWVVFGLTYFYRANKSTKIFVNKIIECCKRW